MPRGGRRPNQTGRPRTASPAVRVVTLLGPAALREAYQAADEATREKARVAALKALQTTLSLPEQF